MSADPLEQRNNAIQQGHELDDVDSRWLKLSATGLVLLIVCTFLIVYGTRAILAREASKDEPPTSAIERTRTATGPQATANQPQLLRELRRAEQERLDSYEWIDELAGIARIPIDRAMEIFEVHKMPTIGPRSEGHHENTSE